MYNLPRVHLFKHYKTSLTSIIKYFEEKRSRNGKKWKKINSFVRILLCWPVLLSQPEIIVALSLHPIPDWSPDQGSPGRTPRCVVVVSLSPASDEAGGQTCGSGNKIKSQSET